MLHHPTAGDARRSAPPVRVPRPPHLTAVGAAGALLMVIACGRDAPTAADLAETTPRFVTPYVAALDLVPATTGPGRGLTVRVRLSDPRATLGPSDRLVLAVRSGTGDAETVHAERAICVREGQQHVCRGFLLLMRPGHTVAEVVSRLPEIGGRIVLTALDGEFASVEITASGDAALDAAMQRARMWPNVLVVEFNGIGRIAGGPPPPAAHGEISLYVSDVTTDVTRPVAGDGRLQVTAAGPVHVSYRQPMGEILTRSVTLP